MNECHVAKKSVILGKKHGMPIGLQSDLELKEGGGKEVTHGIFQSIARKGCVRKDGLT